MESSDLVTARQCVVAASVLFLSAHVQTMKNLRRKTALFRTHLHKK
jgi:hypothetical protein